MKIKYKIGVDMASGQDKTIYAIYLKIMGKLTLIYSKCVPNDQKENFYKFI
jgi:hypothetical protein